MFKEYWIKEIAMMAENYEFFKIPIAIAKFAQKIIKTLTIIARIVFK